MIYLMATSLIWAFSFGLIKSQLTGINPFLVSLIRLFLSFLVFLPFLKAKRMGDVLRLMGIGAIQFGAMYCLYIKSYAWLQGWQVALLTITTPLFVVLIDAAARRGINRRHWIAALLAVLAALSLLNLTRVGSGFALRGVLLLQGANFCFALGQLLYKKYGAGDDRAGFAWAYLGGLLVPAFFLVGSSGLRLPDTANQWTSLLYLGLIPSGLGFFLWNKGARKVGPGVLAVMNNLKIPLGVVVAWLVFGESVDVLELIIAGVLFTLALHFGQ